MLHPRSTHSSLELTTHHHQLPEVVVNPRLCLYPDGTSRSHNSRSDIISKTLRTYRDDTLIILARRFLNADVIFMVPHKSWSMRVSTTTTPRTTVTKWIIDPIQTTEFWSGNRITPTYPLLTFSNGAHVDTIVEIDVDPYMLTRYVVNDYVLRRYPPTKAGDGHPEKYGTYWRGPYVMKNVTPMPLVYAPHDKIAIRI